MGKHPKDINSLNAQPQEVTIRGFDLTRVKDSEKCVAGLCLHLVWRTKPPQPCGCKIVEDLQTLHIPTNKKLEVWTQYRLQATSFFPWWLLLFFQENFMAKEDL